LTYHSFEVSQRRYFLNLLGRRPGDLFIDPVVFDLDRLYLGAISGPGSFTAEGAANAFLLDRPDDMSEGEFARRLEPMVASLPTILEGHAQLVRLVDQTVAELTERVELLGLREERERYLETKVAQTDTTHDGELRERYDGMAGREHHASLRELRALQADRRKYGAGDGDGDDPDGQQPEPDDGGDTPPVSERAQNEATGPEVNGAAEEAEGPVDVNQFPTVSTQAPTPVLGAGLPTPPRGRPEVCAPRTRGETSGPEDGGVGRPAPSSVGGAPRPVSEPAQIEATVLEVNGAGEEAEGPIDAIGPIGWGIPSSNSQIPTKPQISNPKSETSEPQRPVPGFQAPILDSPEEHEAIRAAYQARLQRVLERIEQDAGGAGVEFESHPPGPSD
jgi:hypothetical protein